MGSCLQEWFAKITIWAQLGVHLPHLKIICSFKGPEHPHCPFSLDTCMLSLGPIYLGQGQKLSKGPKCSVWVLSARSCDQRLILGSKYSFWGQSATKESLYQLFFLKVSSFRKFSLSLTLLLSTWNTDLKRSALKKTCFRLGSGPCSWKCSIKFARLECWLCRLVHLQISKFFTGWHWRNFCSFQAYGCTK